MLDAPVSLPLMKSLFTSDYENALQTIGLGGEIIHSLTCLELSSPLVIHFYDWTAPEN